jgi:hypothetical protein
MDWQILFPTWDLFLKYICRTIIQHFGPSLNQIFWVFSFWPKLFFGHILKRQKVPVPNLDTQGLNFVLAENDFFSEIAPSNNGKTPYEYKANVYIEMIYKDFK